MVENTDPHIIGTTESWANKDISDTEIGLTGYIMSSRDRIGSMGSFTSPGIDVPRRKDQQLLVFLLKDTSKVV